MNAGRVIKIILIVFVIGLLFGGIKALSLYRKAFAPNVYLTKTKEVYFYVKTGASYNDVLSDLKSENILKSTKSFEWTANRKNYANHINPGRYLITHRMSNNSLVNMLRSGEQEIVKLTFNNVNTIKEFSERIAKQLEFSSEALSELLTDERTIEKYGFTNYTLPAMFIPNTYDFYWNTSPEKFLDRMHVEYDNFWTDRRKYKAEQIGMTQEEVSTLASIVEKEVIFDDEKRRVAGLYMNRIKQRIRLQADPTLIFALNDYSIRRVLNKHKKLDSPYNTYKIYGLPPGPICIPDIGSIDAVLNYEEHSYIYMCAKEDFSGYHNFAKTLKAHNRNAEAYQRELNKRRIYK